MAVNKFSSLYLCYVVSEPENDGDQSIELTQSHIVNQAPNLFHIHIILISPTFFLFSISPFNTFSLISRLNW